MLSLQGWLNGLSASGLIIIGVLSGIYFIYKSRIFETNSKLVFKTGLMLAFGSLTWLGNFLDFITIIITGRNFNNVFGIIGIISFIWFLPMGIAAVLFSSEVLFPDKKKYIAIVFFVAAVIYEFFLIFDPTSIIFTTPSSSGASLIDYRLNPFSVAGIIQGIFGFGFLVIFGGGFLIKSYKSEGVARKKFLLLAIGFLMALICVILDDLIHFAWALVFVRVGVLCGYWSIFIGLRLENMKQDS